MTMALPFTRTTSWLLQRSVGYSKLRLTRHSALPCDMYEDPRYIFA